MTSERSRTWDDRVGQVTEARSRIAAFDAARDLAPGVLSPRARIDALVDPGSFMELGAFSHSQYEEAAGKTPADGVITGFATVGGREVCLVSEDPLALAGTDGQVGKNKRLRLVSQAVHKGLPVLYLADGAPGPYPEFPPAGGLMHYRLAEQQPARDVAERTAPFIAVLFGQCRGQDATFVAAADIVIATAAGCLRVTEGDGETVAPDAVAADDLAALAAARRALALFPASAGTPLAAVLEPGESNVDFTERERLDDPLRTLDGLLDAGTGVVFGAAGDGLVGGLAAIGGFPVAFVCTGGAEPYELDDDGVRRALRVAALSRRFAIPLLSVQDCAGYAASADPERSLRLVRALFDQLAGSTAIKISLVAGRGHALGDFVLGGRGAGYDLVWAWPEALVGAADVRAYQDGQSSVPDGPWTAADLAVLDDVILPSETREWLVRALRLLAASRAVPPAKHDRALKLVDLA